MAGDAAYWQACSDVRAAIFADSDSESERSSEDEAPAATESEREDLDQAANQLPQLAQVQLPGLASHPELRHQ